MTLPGKTIRHIAGATLLLAAVGAAADSYGEPTYYVTSPTINTAHGWFWEDVNATQKDAKKKAAPPAMRLVDPKRDRRETKEILTSIDNQLKIQIDLMARMLDILEYNFPRRTPKYTINKKTGERCLTNSSADCFVMPVVPEAQQVPVLKEFIRNPNIETAKEWLRFFAVYQNHLRDIGLANSFAYKQYGTEAYPTDVAVGVQLPKGGGEDARDNIKAETIRRMGDRLDVYVFYGKSKLFESLVDPVHIFTPKKGPFANYKNFTIVFNDPKYYTELYKKFEASASKREKEIFAGTKMVQSRALFRRYDVDRTPLVVAVLKDEKGKPIGWQKVAYSNSMGDMVEGIYNFLVFHRVVDPKNINDASAAAAIKVKYGDKYAPTPLPIDIGINPLDKMAPKFDETQKANK